MLQFKVKMAPYYDENPLFKLFEQQKPEFLRGPTKNLAGGDLVEAVVSESDASTARNSRRTRNTNLPKRPLSAYNLFFRDQRALINGENLTWMNERNTPAHVLEARRRNPPRKLSFRDLAREIGGRWAQCKLDDPITIEHYQALASIEKQRYLSERAAMEENQSVDAEGNEAMDSTNLLVDDDYFADIADL